jgi:hypothetical protein
MILNSGGGSGRLIEPNGFLIDRCDKKLKGFTSGTALCRPFDQGILALILKP